MRRTRGIRGGANVGCIIWLVILGFVGYVLYKVVPVKIASSEFFDTMQEQASFGSIKDPKFIEYEILKKAEELQLPIKKDNLKITKTDETIKVEAPLRDHDRLLERHLQVRLEVRSRRPAAALRGLGSGAPRARAFSGARGEFFAPAGSCGCVKETNAMKVLSVLATALCLLALAAGPPSPRARRSAPPPLPSP